MLTVDGRYRWRGDLIRSAHVVGGMRTKAHVTILGQNGSQSFLQVFHVERVTLPSEAVSQHVTAPT